MQHTDIIFGFPKIRFFALSKTALIVLLGAYVSNAKLNEAFLEVLALTVALWAVLYAINETTDRFYENGVTVKIIHLVAYPLAIAVILMASSRLGEEIFIFALAMTMSQVAYSLYPRLKIFWWGALLISGLINPALRFFLGAIGGEKNHAFYLTLIVLLLVNLSGAIITRVKKRRPDSEHHYLPIPGVFSIMLPSIIATSAVGCIGLTFVGILPASCWYLVPPGFLYLLDLKKMTINQIRRWWLVFFSISLVIIADMTLEMMKR